MRTFFRIFSVFSVRSDREPLLLIFFLVVGVRLIGITNPLLDFASYRQTYTAMIAENFALHGIDLLRPEIGIIGVKNISEFPVYPALVAILYKLFGIHEIFGRLLSVSFAGLSALVLFRLARRLYSKRIAFHAGLVFALLPMLVYYTRTFMLESLMLFLSLLAMDGLHRWSQKNDLYSFLSGCLFLSLAILTKIPVLYLGLPALVLVGLYYRNFRPSIFRLMGFLFLLALALLPALLWYFWIPSFASSTDGILSAASSLQNSIFSGKSQALRFYFWSRASTWRLLFLTRPLEYHFTPAGSIVLLFAAWLWIKNIFSDTKNIKKNSNMQELLPRNKDSFFVNKICFLRSLYSVVKEAAKRILGNDSLLFLLSWMLAVFLFMAAFPGFNSLHEYYQIPLLLPGAILIAAALDYLCRQPLFSGKARGAMLLAFLYIGIFAYSSYKLYHRLQVHTDYFAIAQAVRQHSKPDEPVLLLEDLPRPEIFYYARRHGYILGVFAHADKLPSASLAEYTKFAIGFLGKMRKKGVRILIIPKEDWPPLAANFLRQVQSHCPKVWEPQQAKKDPSSPLHRGKGSGGHTGIYLLDCRF